MAQNNDSSSVLENFFSNHVREYTKFLDNVSISVSAFSEFNPSLVKKIQEEDDKLTIKCKELEESLGSDNPQIKEAKERLRKSIKPWYSQSWFINRVLTKPRGYLGDYETIEAIYENSPMTLEGIGFYLDLFFLEKPLANSIRERITMIQNMLTEEVRNKKEKIRILNLASGSLREWYKLLPNVDTKGIELVNIDNDQGALDYSKERLEEVKGDADIKYLKDNALKFGRKKTAENQKRYGGLFDIVYSVGLYDYIPDRFLNGIIAAQDSLLVPGGKQIIAFKDSERYDSTDYDWKADWKFFQRNEASIDEFLKSINLNDRIIEKSRDSTKVILFYKIFHP